MDELRYDSMFKNTIAIEVPLKDAQKLLFDKPHLSGISLSIMAITRASFDTLYSFDNNTFVKKCKPALEPSNYVPVKREHLFYFLIYTVLAIASIAALSQILSGNTIVTAIVIAIMSFASFEFAKSYFSQLFEKNVENGRKEN